MRRWEYTTTSAMTRDLSGILSGAGLHGWELVSVVPHRDPREDWSLLVFKREAEPEASETRKTPPEERLTPEEAIRRCPEVEALARVALNASWSVDRTSQRLIQEAVAKFPPPKEKP